MKLGDCAIGALMSPRHLDIDYFLLVNIDNLIYNFDELPFELLHESIDRDINRHFSDFWARYHRCTIAELAIK